MLNYSNDSFRIFSIKKKSQSRHITFSLIIDYYQYQKVKFSIFTLQHYNLFVLFIIVIFYICFNLGDSYVECVKGKSIVNQLYRNSGTHYDTLGHFVSKYKGSMYGLKTLSHESLHHYKYMHLCRIHYPDYIYIPLPDYKNIQLCDGVLLDPINKEIIKTFEYKFQFNKPVFDCDLKQYQIKYPFLSILDIGHLTPTNYQKPFMCQYNLISTNFVNEVFKELDSESSFKLEKQMEETFFAQKHENKSISKFGKQIVKNEIRLIKN